MKKFYVLAIALLCSVLNMIAAVNHDLIIKTNSEKIEALIQEVSDTELRYKKANNPNGPMFVIKLEEVASIVYANGEVQAIEHKAAPQAQPQQAKPQQQGYNFNNNGYNGYNGGYNNGYNASYGYNNGYNGPLRRIDNKTWMYEDHRMNTKEMKFFLQQTCPQAYNYYHSWNACEITGWVFMGVGPVFILAIGLPILFEASEGAGIGLMSFGIGLTAASVPLVACGHVFKNRVDQVYNVNCVKPMAFQPELRLTSGANGLGLALGF